MSIVFWKDLAPEQRDSETATHCIRLLKQRLDGKITEKEFEHEMHYVTLLPGCLEDHAFREAPERTIELQKAVETLEKEKLNLRANEILDMGAFHKAHPSLMDYQTKLEAIARTNQRNAETLEDSFAYFKSLGDSVSVVKVFEVYKTYPVSIWIGNTCIWKRRTL